MSDPNALKFYNPANNAEEEISKAWVWCLLFGPFYFAYKGVWPHAILSLFIAVVTGGISWLVYPFFTQRVMEKYYLHNGWQRAGSKPPIGRKGDTINSLKELDAMRLSGALTQEEFDELKHKLLGN